MSAHPRLAQAIITVSLAALSVLVVALLLQSSSAAAAQRGKGKKAAKDFTYEVSDCQGAGELDSIRLEVSEGSVAFNQILTMNCIAATRRSTVTLSHAKQGRDLEVRIVLRSDVLSDCTCPIGIDGRIVNLAKGSYRISFVFEHPGRASDDKPVKQTLATKEFSIP